MTIKSHHSLIFCLGLVFSSLLSQTPTKMGGICIRIDDNQSIDKWEQFAEVFRQNNAKFCFAVNLGLVEHDNNYIRLLKKLQSAGHSFQDHTPNHHTLLFTVKNASDYANEPGVDHVKDSVVYLRYFLENQIEEDTYGFINIKNGWAISSNPGEFKDFIQKSVLLTGIYIKELNSSYGVSKIAAYDTTDVDSLFLTSYWGEKVTLSNAKRLSYNVITQYNSHVTSEGIDLLAGRSLDLARRFGLERPKTWIQPGGRWPVLDRATQKQLGLKNSYVSGSGLPESSIKCYNEFNPKNDKQFGMQWGDFSIEYQSFSQVKKIIADNVAKHKVLFGGGHFSPKTGGWNNYLLVKDSLLKWCNAKQIPIRTQEEWTTVLYESLPDPYENIIPRLFTDRNDDKIPDGYTILNSNVSIDSTDGIKESKFYSIKTTSVGSFFNITQLAGVEKGVNDFYFYTKALPGTKYSIYYSFSEYPALPVRGFRVEQEDSNWVRNYFTIDVPDSISIINLFVYCDKLVGKVAKICSMRMRKPLQSPIKIVSKPDTISTLSMDYYYDIEIDGIYDPRNAKFELLDAPDGFVIDSMAILRGNLSTQKPNASITLVVIDSAGNSDKQTFTIKKRDSTLDVGNHVIIPEKFVLFQNYPNPFNPQTTIRFNMASSGFVTLKIFNVLGQKISALTERRFYNSGNHSIQWSGDDGIGNDLPSGVYFYSIEIVSLSSQPLYSATNKMALLR